jgi:hypothetical protein
MTFDEWLDQGHRCGCNENMRKAWNAALESRVLAERKQEPVMWVILDKDGDLVGQSMTPMKGLDWQPLFTHPTPDDASATYREVGVWDTDGRKFRTYDAENLNGKAMYVRDAAMQSDKDAKGAQS